MTEQQIQMDFLWWATNNHPLKIGKYMFAIPNEGRRSRKHGARMKAQGLKSGIPDLFLAWPTQKYAGLFIEMKSEKGKISENQQKWIDRLNEQGYLAVVAFGLDEAKKAVEGYLNERH